MQRESVEDSYYVVAYWSKRYSIKESRRSATDLELRALLGCIEAWKHWLKGHKFTALTDHQALTYLYTKDPSQRSTFEEKAIVKLAEYQLMDIHYIPGKHNVVADYLSRSTNPYQHKIFAIDLCAGCGTFIRALDNTLPLNVQICYAAVEIDEQARKAIKHVIERVNQLRPNRFVSCLKNDNQIVSYEFPFEFGHDVKELHKHYTALKEVCRGVAFAMCTGGPPCQPWSRANPNKRKWNDERTAFAEVKTLVDNVPFDCWYFENVIMTHEDQQQVSELFGCEAVQLNAADLSPQTRLRLVWANFPIEQPSELDILTYGLSVSDYIPANWLAQRDKSYTFMARSHTWSDSHPDSYLLHKETGERRRMYPVEREQCIGLKKGDLTQIFEQPDVIWKLTGNAFPVQVQAHIIREVLRRNLIHSLRRSTESEPPTAHALININREESQPDKYDIKTLRALAGRDSKYVQDLENTTEDSSQFPHKANGLIYQKEGCVRIPNSLDLQHSIVDYYHKHMNHLMADKLMPTLKKHFYWNNMDRIIIERMQSCPVCQITKNGKKRSTALATYPLDPGPFSTVHLDITMLCTGLTQPEALNSALVIVDRFTRYTIIVPCKHSLNTQEMVLLLEKHLFSYFGIPLKIIADNGSPFQAINWKELISSLGSRASNTIAYHPEQNGLVERANRTIKEILKSIVHELQLESPADIMNMCPMVQWTINMNINSTIGISPHEALFGVAPFIPHIFQSEYASQLVELGKEFAEERLKNYRRIFELVSNKLLQWNEKLIKQRDSQQTWIPHLNDLVLHLGPNQKSNVRVPLFNGPYQVIAIDGGKVLLQRERDTITVSHKDLKQYIAPDEHADYQNEDKWEISKINFRDYSNIKTDACPRLNITWKTGQTTFEKEDKYLDPVISAMENVTFQNLGISKVNAAQVYAHQRLVLGKTIPIMVNNGNNNSLTKHTRKRSLYPRTVLMQYVVQQDQTLGLIDDYHENDTLHPWRVSWEDGQISWVPLNFPADNLYGKPGPTFLVNCTRKQLHDWASNQLRHKDDPPLYHYFQSIDHTNLDGILKTVCHIQKKIFRLRHR